MKRGTRALGALLVMLAAALAAPPLAAAESVFTYDGDVLTITDDDTAADYSLRASKDSCPAGVALPCLRVDAILSDATFPPGMCTGIILKFCPMPSRIVANLDAGNDSVDFTDVPVPAEIHGGRGKDEITGGAGNDRIYGERDDDEISGGPGDDLIDGGEGADSFEQAFTIETLFGGPARRGADTIVGGPGEDSMYYWGRPNPVTVTLDGEADDGEEEEGDNVSSDIEKIFGSDQDDFMIGDDGPSYLVGEGGKDYIDGRGGDDYIEGDDTLLSNDDDDDLKGGAGDDEIRGSGGDDILDGGPGQDTMVADDPCLMYSDGSAFCPAGSVPGNDTVYARDGEVDVVTCGWFTDVAVVDPQDEVEYLPVGYQSVCEGLDTGAPASTPTPVPGETPTPQGGTPSTPVPGTGGSGKAPLTAGTVVDSRRAPADLGGAKLTGGTFRVGPTAAGVTSLFLTSTSKDAAKCKRSKTATVRRLTVNGATGLSTVGAAASVTTVSGKAASWTITDRCDGTQVRVTKGSVRVRAAKGKRKTTTVKAGHTLRVAGKPFA